MEQLINEGFNIDEVGVERRDYLTHSSFQIPLPMARNVLYQIRFINHFLLS